MTPRPHSAHAAPGRPPLRRRLAWLALAPAALVLLAVATQALWLGAAIGSRLAATSGRAASIGRATFGLTMALEPVVHLREVEIANAPWAGSARPFARAGEATFVLSWRSLWADRRVVALLVLRDAEIDLERQADGLRNWRLRHPEDRGPGRWRFLALRAERSSMHFVNGAIDLAFDVAAAPNDAAAGNADAALPLALDFHGAWRAVPFRGRVATGSELTFYDTGTTFALRGRLEAGGAVLDADGRAGDILRQPRLDARVSVAGRSLAPLAAFVGERGREPRGFRIAGRLRAEAGRYELSDALATFGRTDLHGSASSERDAGGRERLALDARSDRAELADLEWWLGTPGAAARHPSPVRAPPLPAVAASAPALPLARLRETDLDLRYRAGRFALPSGPELRDMSIVAKLAGGQLSLGTLELGVAGGRIAGQAALDARRDDAVASAELRWQGVRVEQLLPAQAEAHRLTGALRGHAKVSAHGAALKEMPGRASGVIEATLGGGTIASRLDAEMGLELGKVVRSVLAGSEPLPLSCAHVAASLEGGRARLTSLLVESSRTRTTGSGSLDLRNETLDVVLTPQARKSGWFDLERSIRLHGPIGKPEKELVPRAAAPAAAVAAC